MVAPGGARLRAQRRQIRGQGFRLRAHERRGQSARCPDHHADAQAKSRNQISRSPGTSVRTRLNSISAPPHGGRCAPARGVGKDGAADRAAGSDALAQFGVDDVRDCPLLRRTLQRQRALIRCASATPAKDSHVVSSRFAQRRLVAQADLHRTVIDRLDVERAFRTHLQNRRASRGHQPGRGSAPTNAGGSVLASSPSLRRRTQHRADGGRAQRR